MPRFSANLSMLFTEVPFLDRFERAAQAGFEAVEFMFPYAHSPQEIKARLDAMAVDEKDADTSPEAFRQQIAQEVSAFTKVLSTTPIKVD